MLLPVRRRRNQKARTQKACLTIRKMNANLPSIDDPELIKLMTKISNIDLSKLIPLKEEAVKSLVSR